MKQRILFLPGFGEDAFIFSALRKYFTDYTIVDVNYRKSLDVFSTSEIDVWKMSKTLIDAYQITEADILLGHSMGGYFSFVIRELISCQIIMLASFNDPNKVRRVIYNKTFNLSLAKLGFLNKTWFQNYLLKPSKGKYFEKEVTQVVRNFNSFSKSQLTKMMKLSFGEKIHSEHENPVRIHAKNDTVVRPPDEKYFECTLGHFCLLLEVDFIAKIIMKTLTKK